jgi:transcriptional regulator with XRE-family HTH domain
MTVASRWRRRKPVVRRATSASNALGAARDAARFRLDQTAKALGVHPRTLRRWEIGETRPSAAQWSRLAAFFARYAPKAAIELAAAAGVPSPFPDPPAVDVHGIEAAIARAADHLDVAPRRVRAALRDIFAALANAHGTPDDLLRAAQDGDPVAEAE